MTRVLLAAVALALSCAPTGKDDDDDDDDTAEDADSDTDADADADADADTDADADADTDADSDADADADADPAGPCPTYFAYQSTDTRRTFHTTAAYEADYDQSGTSSTRVTTFAADGSQIIAETDATLSIPDFDAYSYTTSETWSCDSDGARLHRMRTDWDVTLNGERSTGWSDTTYSGGVLSMPADIQVGDRWNVNWNSSTTSSTGEPSTNSIAASYHAARETTVSPPAGTFTVLAIDYETGGATGTSYSHEDVGHVLSDSWELVSYSD
jgi:hypothetical protein